MTREERLQYCRVCKNKKLDFKEGILCNLSGKAAEFEDKCENFDIIKGEKVQKTISKKIPIEDIIRKEKITIIDLTLLLIFSIFIPFYIGIINTYNFYLNSIYFYTYIIISCSFLMIIRDKNRSSIRLFEDIKIRFSYALLIPVINIFVQLIIKGELTKENILSIVVFIWIFAYTFISVILVKIYFYLFRR